jgi:exodeoxyribonuclease-3
MKVATWNVNSIRSRLERVLAWLGRTGPDIVCLQELKATEEAFPFEPIREAGYHAAVFGQKTYNGVAILSRKEPERILRGVADDVSDPQARLITAKIDDIHVINAYVPNGQSVGSDKYAYKLEWMRRLHQYLNRGFAASAPILLCGDFNVARDDLDVANPGRWANTVLCDADTRMVLQEVCGHGLVDVFRRHHPEGSLYSWWDYRRLGFPKNDGLRIDYIFASESLAKRCTGAKIDRDERKGTRPSDHAPVIAQFEN